LPLTEYKNRTNSPGWHCFSMALGVTSMSDKIHSLEVVLSTASSMANSCRSSKPVENILLYICDNPPWLDVKGTGEVLLFSNRF
jgi:hypothetical protein